MIKLLLSGLWVCAVTLLASYGVFAWRAAAHAPAHEPQANTQKGTRPGLQVVKSRMISVPIISSGALHGYVMAQFAFTADDKLMKHMSVKPEVYLLDEAFKAIYASESIDFRSLKKQDLPALSQKITESINARLGARVVEDVLIQELNYIPKDRVRGGPRP